MKRYKVVTYDKYSIFAPGSAAVEYDVGEFVSAPEWLGNQGYHLTVFRTLEQARDFVEKEGMTDEVEIWECEVQDQVELKERCYLYLLAQGYFQIIFDEEERQWPCGTEMWKRVRLTRLVEQVNQVI